jgi:DNA-binding transcriptional LysR family regulator
MDLRQLNALLAVAGHGSFSAAARALHTVQSNVSTHVARLEREVGATLIDRTTGLLTEEGEVVAARARRIQGELDALAADVASLHDQITGSVTLGMIGTTGRWLAPIVLEAMAAAHPQVRLVVVDATTASLLPRLLGGQLDLAVVNLPVADADLTTEELFTEDTVLLVPARHPLADRQRVAFADLDGMPLLLEPEGTTFRALLEAQAGEAGIELVAQAEVDGMRLLASLAFEGFGATLVPATAVPRWLQGGDWRRLGVDGLRGRSVGLAQRRRGLLSAPARSLVEVVRHVVTDEAHNQSGVTVAHALSAR